MPTKTFNDALLSDLVVTIRVTSVSMMENLGSGTSTFYFGVYPEVSGRRRSITAEEHFNEVGFN